jgi:hypothetical protein
MGTLFIKKHGRPLSRPFEELWLMPKCALYRHFDKNGALLYVGISISPTNRNKNHSSNADWFQQVVRIDIEWCASKEAALWAEDVAIRQENPRHNISRGNKKGPASRDPEVQKKRLQVIAEIEGLGFKVNKILCLGALQDELTRAKQRQRVDNIIG